MTIERAHLNLSNVFGIKIGVLGSIWGVGLCLKILRAYKQIRSQIENESHSSALHNIFYILSRVAGLMAVGNRNVKEIKKGMTKERET